MAGRGRPGEEATSLAELTRAMSVTPPSIYAADGDRKGLFCELEGLSTPARNGATRERLMKVARFALAARPGAHSG